MNRCFRPLLPAFSALFAFSPVALAVDLPDLEDGYSPPITWDGPIFRLSKAYPTTSGSEPQPWKDVGFDSPVDYLNTVITYCFEGNLDDQSADPAHFDDQFKVAINTVRKWYHAPWLQIGRHPREFVHGLTDERKSEAGELAGSQTTAIHNYAVGFYNPTGGYTFGQIWLGNERPDEGQPTFGEGTVTFKLLFTEADETQIPWLAGAPVWHADEPRKTLPPTIASAKALRLLQVDIAVKDARSKCGGWIFGTFHYDAAIQNSNPWRRLRPFALMWGNDPGLTATQFENGQGKPQESWLNPDSPLYQYRASGQAPFKTFGWAGRANGPVDNPVSSCLSCHSTAQRPVFPNLFPPKTANDDQRLNWFRNLAPGEPFQAGAVSMDFSLQLASGVGNYSTANPSGLFQRVKALFVRPRFPDISRAGEPQ